MIQNFVGYDISPDMVRLSLVNLYLHGFSDPHIWEYDTLSSEERWNEGFDVVLANPPFMTPKGGIRPHKKFTIKSNRSEVLFVDYIAEHLNPNGRAGVIVPEGVIFQSGKAYKDLRKMLVEDYLYAVVSLPAGVFNPYSNVKTSILLMDKQLAKQTNEILFVKIDNDGYNLGAQRTAIDGSQLDEALGVLEQFKTGIISESKLAHYVEKQKIAENGEYSLSSERYKVQIKVSRDYEMHKIGSVAKVVSGSGFPTKYQGDKDELYPFYKVSDMNLVGNEVYMRLHNNSISSETLKELNAKFYTRGTVIFPKIGAAIATNKKRIITKESLFDNNVMGLVPNENTINPYYLYSILQSIDLSDWASDSQPPSMRKSTVEEFQIPLPSLSIQEEIVAEIEMYQKIIDGAKMVVNNYKPTINIDSNWEQKKLGEISDLKNGLNFSKESSGEQIKIIGVSHFKNNLIAPISEVKTTQVNDIINDSYLLKKGDIIFVRSNGNKELVGRSMVIPDVDERISFSGFTIRCRLKEGVEPLFVGYLFKSKLHSELMKNTGRGANIRNLSQGILSEISIPIPSIEIQHEIIATLEKEQELITANTRLIQIYEQKIKNCIAKVWGSN